MTNTYSRHQQRSPGNGRLRHWLKVMQTCREQLVAVAVEFEVGGRGTVAAAEAQQTGCAVCQVKEPLLEGVVGCATHQQRLPRKEVQGGQRAIVCIL